MQNLSKRMRGSFMNKFRSDENAELVKENEGFFVLKLVASEIHFLRLGARDSFFES